MIVYIKNNNGNLDDFDKILNGHITTHNNKFNLVLLIVNLK